MRKLGRLQASGYDGERRRQSSVSREAPGPVAARGVAEGRLLFQRCERCGTAVYPARVLCPRCGSRELAWRESGGRGTVYSVTVVHRRDERYDVALVDLDEGFRVMTEVVGVDPDAVRIGMAVVARPEAERIAFVPADG